ncbi:MAG: TlpA family protein disulfide reductase [Planctomycetaceae bacterium]|nr:TlpA family protein disulfide reductase [Planctomycetaceae bacterium]
MSIAILRASLFGSAGLISLALWGCGKPEVAPAADAASATDPSAQASRLPTAAIKSSPADPEEEEDDLDDAAEEPAAAVELKEGSPEWLIHEATKLRLQPSPKTTDVEHLKAHRKKRNEKVIELCQKAIAQVHGDAAQERLFSVAVHNMLEARLQLALAGERDSIDALYEDAAALFQRDPKSAAAAAAAHALVNLAYSQAKAGGSEKRKWLEEFARQATHFAEDFPTEERRALPLLFTAARSCEIGGLVPEALECYTLIQQKFPQSAYAPRVAAVVRRLKLVGNPPQIAGPTIDGDQVVLDDLLGQAVLVVFWSTDAKPFLEGLPSLLQTIRNRTSPGIRVIGVNLDQDPTSVTQFTLTHKISWPQIFFSEPAQQGWNNPIVGYYGIMELPALWLIDQSGNVVSTTVTIETLDDELRKLLADSRKTPEESDPGPAASATASRPARGSQKPSKTSAPKIEEE